jgi:hypothetical protein
MPIEIAYEDIPEEDFTMYRFAPKGRLMDLSLGQDQVPLATRSPTSSTRKPDPIGAERPNHSASTTLWARLAASGATMGIHESLGGGGGAWTCSSPRSSASVAPVPFVEAAVAGNLLA